ncbi:MAG: zinc ribbon domain-containing protein [Candidatus Obscuribacterales bacterium]|nr:zinc ribbon domain-containing protein [Candidatus Obscuribacterales bacterium]
MPNYDYRCTDCREAFTVERSMKDSSETSCTSCGSGKVSRIWNMFIRSGGITTDVGQSRSTATKSSGGGCGSCCGSSCASC